MFHFKTALDCPHCGKSSDGAQTSDVDVDYIQTDECQHTFDCEYCGCAFAVRFQPVSAQVIEKPKEGFESIYADEVEDNATK